MKKYIFIGLLFSVLFSCNDDFLERPPLDTLTNENFWQSEAHLISGANALYTALKGKDILNMFESMGETAPWAITTAYRTIGGGTYSTDITQVNNIWVGAYYNIGRCNFFLNNYQRATSVTENKRERYAAEAYFFRAYDYWLLTTVFGDVPYITKELNVFSSDVYRGRDSRTAVIDSITADLERTYRNLPVYIAPASGEFGRITQAAALTLLSRIYLYNERWSESANAAQRAMGLGYELYSTGDPTNDYRNLFNFTGRASRIATNKETILAYVYNFDLGAEARSSHNLSRELWVPNDYARFTPTKTMIEKWLTADGNIWNPSLVNTYDEVFENRDPRMKQSILAPNTLWEGRKDGDPNNLNTALFTYPKFSNDKDGCMTYSGYYMYKYVEPSKVGQVSQDENDIIFFRYAEVLLNYAEARERAGGLTQATLDSTINLLRDRVGMVHLQLTNIPTGSDIRTEIQRERTVELFFEGHRYPDIIRWRQGEVLGEDLLGVNRRWLDASKLATGMLNTLKWKTVNGEQYLIIEAGRTFNPGKHYLLSLPFTQMQRNPNLRPNNPGWN